MKTAEIKEIDCLDRDLINDFYYPTLTLNKLIYAVGEASLCAADKARFAQHLKSQIFNCDFFRQGCLNETQENLRWFNRVIDIIHPLIDINAVDRKQKITRYMIQHQTELFGLIKK